jgi:branched-chain amino acid transport system substrate-binding protein
LSRLKQSGFTGRFLMAEAFAAPRMLTTISKAAAAGAEIMCTCAPATGDQAFADAYRAKFGVDPIAFAPETYDATWILLKGISAGNVTREDLANYVRSYSGVGITKPIAFDDNGDVRGQPSYVYKLNAEGTLDFVKFIS